MKKSQVSVEFFMFVGLGLVIAIIFELVSLDQLDDFRKQNEGKAVKDMALKLQKEVIIAASVEDGYSRYFGIPQHMDGINYSIIMLNSTLTVQSRHGFYLVPIPFSIGNFTKGSNMINKTGGVININ